MAESQLVAERPQAHPQRPMDRAAARTPARDVKGAFIDWLLAWLFGAAALGVHLYHMGSRSLWEDEAVSVGIAHQPWQTQAHYIWSSEVFTALYYLLLRAWLHIIALLSIAQTELVVRLPSAILVALSVAVVFLIGRRFWGRAAGVVAAGLYLLNYLQLMMAGQARSYALLLFFVCLAYYAFLSALTAEHHAKWWWICYSAATTVAIYSHVISLLIVSAQLISVVSILVFSRSDDGRIRKHLLGLITSLTAVAILVLPLGVDIAVHGKSNAWLAAPDLKSVLRLGWEISGHSVAYAPLVIATCVLGVLAAIGSFDMHYLRPRLAMWQRNRPDGNTHPASPHLTEMFVVVCWLVIPMVFSFALSLHPLNLRFFGDYLVEIVPAVCILAGIGVNALQQPHARIGLALVLLVLALPAVPLYYRHAQRQDFRGASAWLEQQYRPGDGLVLSSPSAALAMDYYLRAAPGPIHAPGDSLGAFWWERGVQRQVDFQSLAAYGQEHPRIFLVGALLGGDSEDVKERARAEQQWLDDHDRLVSETVTSGYYGAVVVRLYTTANYVGGIN